MDKQEKPLPLTVARERFRKALEDLVNTSITSGLPACIMYDAVSEVHHALEKLMNQQYRRDLEEYEKEGK